MHPPEMQNIQSGKYAPRTLMEGERELQPLNTPPQKNTKRNLHLMKQ